MYFSIYDLEVGGVALYNESFQVQLSNGRYMAEWLSVKMVKQWFVSLLRTANMRAASSALVMVLVPFLPAGSMRVMQAASASKTAAASLLGASCSLMQAPSV